jgi:hypothetical protein
MQKWEYMVRIISGEKVRIIRESDMLDEQTTKLLNTYGEQGWELISETDSIFTFKRPKA